MLATSCLDAKIKYGCAVWNALNQSQMKDLNIIKLNMIKRVMQLPYSTPSIMVQYEFGIIDLDLEVLMEKVLLYFDTLKHDSSSIARELLEKMMSKNVPGFCSEVKDALQTLDMSGDMDRFLEMDKDKLREICKNKLIIIQEKRILKKMLES